ncbi:hypothetical protein ABZP36_005931 [Zizania latifolia]
MEALNLRVNRCKERLPSPLTRTRRGELVFFPRPFHPGSSLPPPHVVAPLHPIQNRKKTITKAVLSLSSQVMALLRKLFARKAMGGVSCFSERVYVFNSCLSTEPLDDARKAVHLTSTVIQLKSCHPQDASLMLLNFYAAAGSGKSSLPVDALLQHGVAAVTEYPCHRYAPARRGCLSLPLATTREILASCVDWLVTNGQRNILLMHCEDGAWPALALAMASLLVYMEEPAPELKTTLAKVYGRAPRALLAAGSELDPQPSHLRYLQYVTRLRSSLKRMSRHETLILDCLILRAVPDFDGNGGCRPIVRVHGPRDGDQADDPSPKVLFSTQRIKQQFRQYNQAKNAVIKANIECQVHGDVVVECAHVGENTDQEQTMFRIMFNTCFVQSNMMVLTQDDIDLPWNCNRERFQEDFKIEVFFSELEPSDTDSPTVEMLGDSHDGNAEEFYDFDDISIGLGSNSKDHERLGEEGESKTSYTTNSSSEEKGSTGSDNGIRFIPEAADVNRESKDGFEETGNLQDGSSSTIRSTLLISEDPNPETATELQQGKSRRGHEEVIHQVEEASTLEGATSSIRSVAINPQPKRTWQNLSKQSAIPIIKKKTKKPDIGSGVKKPSKGKMLLKQTLQRGILIATSSCKNTTAQAMTDPTPRKQHENAIKSKHGTAQARNTPALSKTHLEHSSHQAIGEQVVQKDNGGDNTTEPKPATFTSETPPSLSSPPSQRSSQEGSKNSLLRTLETAMKSPNHASGNSTTREPKQESTMASTDVPRPKMVLKKSLSSPNKSSITTSLPSMKPNHPSSVSLKVASSSSPRARASPSPPRTSPLVSSRVNRAAPPTRPATQPATSTPAARMPRRVSFGDSTCSPFSTNGRSPSPRGSRMPKSHPIGMKDSSRSLSPLSPRSARAQQSPETYTAATGASGSKGSSTSSTLAPHQVEQHQQGQQD